MGRFFSSYGFNAQDHTDVNLLLLHGRDINSDTASHVAVIKDVEKFTCRNYSKTSIANTYICTNCHVTFHSVHVWENHMKIYMRNEYATIIMPKDEDLQLKYNYGDYVYPHHIFICADFEAVSAPIENTDSCEEGFGEPTCEHRKSLRERLMEVSAYSWQAIDIKGKIIDSDYFTGQ